MTENQLRFLAHEESARHNRATEDVAEDTLAETKRSNVARETETNRANVAKETETHRSNVAKETETHRANVAQETEKERSNRANEDLTKRGQNMKFATDAVKAATSVVKVLP